MNLQLDVLIYKLCCELVDWICSQNRCRRQGNTKGATVEPWVKNQKHGPKCGLKSVPLFILCYLLGVVRHEHVMGPFERPEHQGVDRMFLHILQDKHKHKISLNVIKHHKDGNIQIQPMFYQLNILNDTNA